MEARDRHREGKKKLKIVSCTATKIEFAGILEDETEEFKQHVERVQIQYDQLKALKDRLPQNHAIVQMDFAENYTCQASEEVQSAYWNASMVTLHPAVSYMFHEDIMNIPAECLCLKSSGIIRPPIATVFAIMKRLVSEIKTVTPDLKHIHYYTDSVTSQYRNKSIFYIVSRHKSLFSVSASWNYFEAGHGKGPCDGVGGSVKRMADDRDEAVK